MSVKAYPPPAGWSEDGHRLKHQRSFERTWGKVWVYGALRVRDGQALTLSVGKRDTDGYLRLLDTVDQANPEGDLYLIADNLASHKSVRVQLWFAEHPRVHPVYTPVGAGWLNLIEPWWRLLRRNAFAGQTFELVQEVEQAVAAATRQLNCRAKPWVWGRPPQKPRYRRRRCIYCL